MIPVTGVDPGMKVSALRPLFMNVGLTLLGVALAAHGVALRVKEE